MSEHSGQSEGKFGACWLIRSKMEMESASPLSDLERLR